MGDWVALGLIQPIRILAQVRPRGDANPHFIWH
jgi:hypothetical protein